MENIELKISSQQKETFQKLCVENGEPAENYVLMAQVLLNEVID